MKPKARPDMMEADDVTDIAGAAPPTRHPALTQAWETLAGIEELDDKREAFQAEALKIGEFVDANEIEKPDAVDDLLELGGAHALFTGPHGRADLEHLIGQAMLGVRGLSTRAPIANGHAFEDPQKPAAELAPLEFLDATTLAGQDVPPRRWLVPHRIPRPNVTMLSGDGAAGKTTIALQLAVATVRGTDWLGSVVDQPGPAIFFTAEEDRDEIHRRLDAIAAHQKIGFAELAGLHLLCLPNDEPALGIAEGKSGVIRATALFKRLLKAATEIRPALIVIEAAADVFAGNENDRAQVRQFVGLLRRLAIGTDAAVLLIAHPSLTGLASGTGTSGSTGWNNSVRSRLYFKAPKSRDRDEAEPDSDVRQLEVMKSNYGPAGEVVRLRWQRGVFVPEGTLGTIERVSAEAEIDAAYLDCLDAIAARGDRVGQHTGRIYAPSIFQKMPQARGYRAKAFAAAQERLFNAGRIEVKPYGSPSKQVSMIVRKAAQ